MVAIPTINSAAWTVPLAEHLLLADEIDELRIYDAGDDFTSRWARYRRRLDDRVVWIDNRNQRLYDTWNRAIMEHSHTPTNVAILNADIRLPPNGIQSMAKAMREGGYQIASIDPTMPAMHSQHHKWYNGPLAELTEPQEGPRAVPNPNWVVGWAYMVAAEFWRGEKFAIDPAYEWWYGDDDLWLRTTKRGGRACFVRGVGSDHLGSVSDPYNENKKEKTERDFEHYKKVWGA